MNMKNVATVAAGNVMIWAKISIIHFGNGALSRSASRLSGDKVPPRSRGTGRQNKRVVHSNLIINNACRFISQSVSCGLPVACNQGVCVRKKGVAVTATLCYLSDARCLFFFTLPRSAFAPLTGDLIYRNALAFQRSFFLSSFSPSFPVRFSLICMLRVCVFFFLRTHWLKMFDEGEPEGISCRGKKRQGGLKRFDESWPSAPFVPYLDLSSLN